MIESQPKKVSDTLGPSGFIKFFCRSGERQTPFSFGSRSLRLRLQLWHAMILASVIVVFAVALYRQLRHATLSEIDGQLLSGARVIEGSLRALDAAPGKEDRWQALSTLPLSIASGPSGRPGPPRHFDRSEELPLDHLDRPGSVERPPPRPLPVMPLYFAIFADGGKLLRDETGGVPVAWEAIRRPLDFRNTTEGRREILLLGPRRSLIVVGSDVSHSMQRLTEALIQLIVIGCSVLALGLLGGWWLAGKVIQPIARISHTAEQITAKSLSERIDTTHMDLELQSLSGTLNSMLGRLEDSFERQSQFTADASHELRTPIAVLLSHCELALCRQRSDDEYRHTIATCQTAAQRMQNLVDGLMTLARADAGELELQHTPVDLHALATETQHMFTPLAQTLNVAMHLEGESAVCIADALRISQVLSNLLHNAILYNQPSGQVTMTTAVEGACVLFCIQDMGSGIPAEALPHLFDRFYRVDQARARHSEDERRGGSGLGLAICKSIVDAHGGTLTVTSQVSQGSQFELRLPREGTKITTPSDIGNNSC